GRPNWCSRRCVSSASRIIRATPRGSRASTCRPEGKKSRTGPSPTVRSKAVFPGVAAADAADVHLGHVLPRRRRLHLVRQHPATLVRGAVGLLPAWPRSRGGEAAGTRRADVRDMEGGPAAAMADLARTGASDGVGPAARRTLHADQSLAGPRVLGGRRVRLG